MGGHLKISIALVLTYYQFLFADGTCYYPDQSVPSNPYYSSCQTDNDGYSACCAPGDQCTVNGYCLGNAGYMYRGGCTDMTWQSLSCPQQCKDAATHSYSSIYPCPLYNGSFATYWCCCGETGENLETWNGCCNGALFKETFGRVIATSTIPSPSILSSPSSASVKTVDSNASEPATSSIYITESLSFPVSSKSLSSSATAPTPTPVETSSCPSNLSEKDMVLGTGVGGFLAVHLLFGLAFFFVRERRRRVRAEKMTDDVRAAAKERERAMEMEITTAKDYHLRNRQFPQELEHVPRGPNEIDSQEVHEANGGLRQSSYSRNTLGL